jgi:hypothetical protein
MSGAAVILDHESVSMSTAMKKGGPKAALSIRRENED